MYVCVCCLDAAAQQHPGEEEDAQTPNYEEKAQEIVQSILQEVVNTVAGGEMCFIWRTQTKYKYIWRYSYTQKKGLLPKYQVSVFVVVH